MKELSDQPRCMVSLRQNSTLLYYQCYHAYPGRPVGVGAALVSQGASNLLVAWEVV